MKLFNAISNQWFEATEYTEKAWREGRREFLFDYEPTHEERKSAWRKENEKRSCSLAKSDIAPSPTPKVLSIKVDGEVRFMDGQNYIDLGDFFMLPDSIFNVVDEVCEGNAKKWGFEEAILEYGMNCCDDIEEGKCDDYFDYKRTVRHDDYVLEVYSSSYIKDQIICDEKFEQACLYTKESYDRETSRENVVNSMDGAVSLENDMYSNIDVADILKSTLGDLGVDCEVVENENGELEFKYEK